MNSKQALADATQRRVAINEELASMDGLRAQYDRAIREAEDERGRLESANGLPRDIAAIAACTGRIVQYRAELDRLDAGHFAKRRAELAVEARTAEQAEQAARKAHEFEQCKADILKAYASMAGAVVAFETIAEQAPRVMAEVMPEDEREALRAMVNTVGRRLAQEPVKRHMNKDLKQAWRALPVGA